MPGPKHFKISTEDVAINELLDGALSSERFEKWRARAKNTQTLSHWILGEIFWRKPLGRPRTPSLYEGFEIETSREQYEDTDRKTGIAIITNFPFPERNIKWWDTPSDSGHWRVLFRIQNAETGLHAGPNRSDLNTSIRPHIRKDVSWMVTGIRPRSRAGIRKLEPAFAKFVKGDEMEYRSFEVVE